MTLWATTADENGGGHWGTPPGRPAWSALRPIAKLSIHNSKVISFVAALLVVYVVSFAPILISAAAIVGLAVGILLLRSPVWGAYLLVLSVPVQKAVSYNAGPVEITVTQALFVAVLGVWWAWLAVRQDRRLVLT